MRGCERAIPDALSTAAAELIRVMSAEVATTACCCRSLSVPGRLRKPARQRNFLSGLVPLRCEATIAAPLIAYVLNGDGCREKFATFVFTVAADLLTVYWEGGTREHKLSARLSDHARKL
jgi:hypothetical protein